MPLGRDLVSLVLNSESLVSLKLLSGVKSGLVYSQDFAFAGLEKVVRKTEIAVLFFKSNKLL